MSAEVAKKVLEFYSNVAGAPQSNAIRIFFLLKDLRQLIDEEDLDWLDLVGRVNNSFQPHLKFIETEHKNEPG